MRAAAILEGREDDANRLGPGLLRGSFCINPCNRCWPGDIADAGGNILRDIAIPARGLLGEIGAHALQPGFGTGFAVMGDDGRDKRGVVGVQAIARADLALEARLARSS